MLTRGYFLVAREAAHAPADAGQRRKHRLRRLEEWLAPARERSAYSSAKAAELHLARCLAEELGPDGIRVNTVNPDAVLEGSRIWDPPGVRRGRVPMGSRLRSWRSTTGMRTTLKVNVLPGDDTYEAIVFLASPGQVGEEHRQRAERGWWSCRRVPALVRIARGGV